MAELQFYELLGPQITATLKTLLEKKHLYQSLVVDTQAAREQFLRAWSHSGDSHRDALLSAMLYQEKNWRWLPDIKRSVWADDVGSVLRFSIPNFRTFCSKCDRIEPHNFSQFADVLGKTVELQPVPSHPGQVIRPSVVSVPSGPHTGTNGTVNVYALSFVCQGCQGVPIVFLVRREGLKLTLTGRTPIEQVQVPGQIPKSISKHYSDAVIAHQSGQTLAGLFMLRVTIEQFVRPWRTAPDEWTDRVIDSYMAELPSEFSGVFPSLRDWWGRLSDAIHEAKADAELFDEALAKIDHHFEGRKAYRLEDKPKGAAPGASPTAS